MKKPLKDGFLRMIEFFPLNRRGKELSPDFFEIQGEVYNSGKFISDQSLTEFETNFANYIGARYAVGVGNGLDALKISLRAAGISKGDWVIVPGFSFIATWLAVLDLGAIPIPIDVESNSGNINLNLVRVNLDERVKAIIVVHLYGNPSIDINFVKEMNDLGIKVIEDAAQAHGAKVGNLSCGNIGNFSAFSFYPTKNLGAAGDAGIILTNDTNDRNIVRSIANYGRGDSKYDFIRFGYNSRLDEIQASALNFFLRYLDNWNSKRANIANQYIKSISSRSDQKIVHLNGTIRRDVIHCYHLFVCSVDDRENFVKYLQRRGISSEVHYPHYIYDFDFILNEIPEDNRKDLSQSKRLSESVVSIPLHPWLEDWEVKTINDALVNY
jgi:dTDP-3-amino-3,4,6-trideoxy-alpha-D-glucose transaminase